MLLKNRNASRYGERIFSRNLATLFKQAISIFMFWLFTVTGVHAMEQNDALAMVQTWITESRATERDIIGSMKVDLHGGFLVRIKGAIFRYEPTKHRLLVAGLVGYQVDMLSLYPELWQKLIRVGQREYTTMMYGEAHFELLPQPLFDLKPDVVLLTKPYTERLTDGRKLSVQIRWLLSDADYWFVNRYNEAMGKTEEELIKEAPGINEWMLKKRPRPW
jgi:hypothetical protein